MTDTNTTTNTTSTTPEEFLQFAKEMGLGRIMPTSSLPSPLPPSSIPNNDNNNYHNDNKNNNSYATIGLFVLNNLCRLIEHVHTLQTENDRLRARLELADQVEKFKQRLLVKEQDEQNKVEKSVQTVPKIFFSSIPDGNDEDEKNTNLSTVNMLKVKHTSNIPSPSNREQHGLDLGNNVDEFSSASPMDNDQSEMVYSSSGFPSPPNWTNWNKVRHALRFSLRRKQALRNTASSPPIERHIPEISVSFESDDDHSQQQQQQHSHQKKKKKKLPTTTSPIEHRKGGAGEDTDLDDEWIQLAASSQQTKSYHNDTANSSGHEHQETQIPQPCINDDGPILARKKSTIAHYRHKLRSKFHTVKKQFSEQSHPPSPKLFHSPGLTFDEIGVGLNHALLTAKLAPALTKSYLQKMRDWESMQKSAFLVNYRRQSISNKTDPITSRKTSLAMLPDDTPMDSILLSSPLNMNESNLNESIIEINESNPISLSPLLSPNQRSLIVHQWREIMAEEILIRRYIECLQTKLLHFKQLETDLKLLKTNIFCTNSQDLMTLRPRSMIDFEQSDRWQQFLPTRCRSLQSLVTMPASWILAVQSAAYSDVVDGTSSNPTERAINFNKTFFDRFEHFKHDRHTFAHMAVNDLQDLYNSKPEDENNVLSDIVNSSNRPRRIRLVLTRGKLRKLSLISSAEMPEYLIQNPTNPCQVMIETNPSSEFLPTPTNSEPDPQIASSTTTTTKRSKRSRFDLKKTFQRSKSMCLDQFHSWLQRRRQQQHQPQPSAPSRRKSAAEIKSSTPTLLGSPRLARLHQKIFKSHPTSELTSPIDVQPFEETNFQCESKPDPPVRIYLPPITSTITRHVRITDISVISSRGGGGGDDDHDGNEFFNQNISSESPSPIRFTTAKERRESYAATSTTLNNRRS